MTDASYVHLILIVDRSGSMQSIQKDAQGGLRSAVAKWAETSGGDKRTLSLYQFDTQHDTVLHYAPLEKAQDYVLEPRGGTALLDATGFAIKGEGEHLASLKEAERPGQVVVIIVTDGQENSSKEYKRPEVKKLIEHQQDKYGWKFTYVAADLNAAEEARSMGIAAPGVLSWMGTARSMNSTYDVLATAVQAGTASTTSQVSYSSAQRDEVMKP